MRGIPFAVLPDGVRAGEYALLGATVPLGWVLFDASVFLHGRATLPVLTELLPGSLAGVLVGALIGRLVTLWRPALPALLVVSAVASVAPRLVDLSLARSVVWLPRATFLMLCALAVTSHVHARWRLGVWRLGLGAGVLCGTAKMAYLAGRLTPLLSAVSIGVLVVVLLGALRSPLVRRLATAAVVLVPVTVVGRWAQVRTRLPRPDLPPPAVRPPADAPNLVLIVLDTVRADRLAPYGYERVTTPRIDAFVRDHATIYAEARSTSSWTLPSHASMLTGLFPSEHGATNRRSSAGEGTFRGRSRLRGDVPTLAEHLREAGYQTAAIVANGFNLSFKLGIGRGFEHYDDRVGCFLVGYNALAQLAGGRPWLGHRPYRGGRTITDLAIDWLDSTRRGGAFFLMLNYMDAHSPLIPPYPYDRAFSDERPVDPLRPRRELMSLLYDRSLLYLDSQVDRFLQALLERGLFEDSVVVITSDHGEALGDHGIFGHPGFLYEELVHVPLYVKPAGSRSVALEREPINGAQVYHLALEELGMAPAVPDPASGMAAEWFQRLRNAPKGRDRDLITWLEGRLKIIVSSKGVVEAYDLDEDPGELHPLPLPAEHVEAARLRARTWWEARPPTAPSLAPIDEEMRAALRALGYGY